MASGNKAYKSQTAAYILSADGSTVVAVSPTFRGEFTAEQAVAEVQKAAEDYVAGLSE